MTAEMMQRHGIKAYMSGCLTLTLGEKYGGQEHNGDYIIVDPYIEIGGESNFSHSKKIIRTLFFCLKNFRKNLQLQRKYVSHNLFNHPWLPRFVQHFMEAATFYEIYSQRFSDEILLNAVYKTVIVDNDLSNEEKFEIADRMLKDYANAKFVITSRLHVAFPCIAMSTKNVFIIPQEKNEEKGINRYRGRLNGLEDTVIVLELKDGKIINTKGSVPQMITPQNIPDNQNGYIKYRDSLIKKVTDFVSNNV